MTKLLFLRELATMNDAEHRLAKALSKMVRATAAARLRRIFQSHLTDTAGHVGKLELMFDAFGQTARTRKCHDVVEILEQGARPASDQARQPALDGWISALQNVGHYKIAAYGSLRHQAERLGHVGVIGLLEEILHEERQGTALISKLGHTRHIAAAGGSSGSDKFRRVGRRLSISQSQPVQEKDRRDSSDSTASRNDHT